MLQYQLSQSIINNLNACKVSKKFKFYLFLFNCASTLRNFIKYTFSSKTIWVKPIVYIYFTVKTHKIWPLFFGCLGPENRQQCPKKVKSVRRPLLKSLSKKPFLKLFLETSFAFMRSLILSRLNFFLDSHGLCDVKVMFTLVKRRCEAAVMTLSSQDGLVKKSGGHRKRRFWRLEEVNKRSKWERFD